MLFDSGNLLGSSWKNDQFVINGNLYWDTRTGPDLVRMNFSGATLEQWKARGHDTNSIVAEPLFMDAAKNDYRFQPGSPAAKLGFKPINPGTVGVRAKAERD